MEADLKDEVAPTNLSPDSGNVASLPTVASTDPYEYRPPINLDNPKLRKLAAALEPSYLRVSGTWMNSTFFQDDDAAILATAPKGYKGVLTRAEWKGRFLRRARRFAMCPRSRLHGQVKRLRLPGPSDAARSSTNFGRSCSSQRFRAATQQ